jgi:DNA-binding response OmpR family regulator
MINDLKLKRDLKRLDYEEHLALKQYEISPCESNDAIQGLETQRGRIQIEFEDRKRSLVVGFLLRKAEKKLIPRPEFNEQNWIKNEDESYHLSESAINELRSKIRAENHECIEMVIKILAVIIGVIGSLSGLVAVIKK